MRPILRVVVLVCAALLAVTALAGCEWTVPITEKPTRKVQPLLLGDWISDGDESTLRVRRFDDWNYVVVVDDDALRVHHSDVQGAAYVSARMMAPDDTRYMYFAWSLSTDGQTLVVRNVNRDRVPYETRTSSDVQKLLARHHGAPDLFDEDTVRYTRTR